MPRATRRQLQSFDRDDSSQASSSAVASSSRYVSRTDAWEYAGSPSTSAYNDIDGLDDDGDADVDGYGRMDEDADGDGGSAWGEGDGEGDGLDEEDLEAYAAEADDDQEESELDRSGKRRTLYGRGTDVSDSEASSGIGTPSKKRGRQSATPTSAPKRRKTTAEPVYTPSPAKSNGRKRATPSKKSTAATNTNWWTKLLSTASAGDDLAIQGSGMGNGGFASLNAADRYFLAAARPKVRKNVNGHAMDGIAGVMSGFQDENGNESSDGVDGEGDEDEKGMKGKRGLLLFGGPSKLNKRQSRMDKSEAAIKQLKRSYGHWASLLLGYDPSAPLSNASTTTFTAHSLLFFGHGSKRSLINNFTTTRLGHLGHVVTINGLYPGIGIREVLQEIEGMFEPEMRGVEVEDDVFGHGLETGDGLGGALNEVKGLDKLAARVYKYFLPAEVYTRADGSGKGTKRVASPTSSKPLFLIIHNIDSPSLRTTQSLSILSLLALNPRIHLVASFDHANTPILFSNTENRALKHEYARGGWKGRIERERGFGWAWLRADTYEAYTLEAEWMRQRVGGVRVAELGGGGSHGSGGDVTEEGAQRILHSVPPMARRLFKLLATRQLASIPVNDVKQNAAHPPTATTPAAPIFAIDNDILQALARDRFIAREEERYNAQMGEFRDHGLIVEHAVDAEGRTGRWLWIPLARVVLDRVVGSMTGVEA